MNMKIKASIILLIINVLMIVSCNKDNSSNDSTPPIITLNGSKTVYVGKDSIYTDLGATAYDETDGDITNKIVVTKNVNISIEGIYFVKYNVKDNADNAAVEVSRTVKVQIFK